METTSTKNKLYFWHLEDMNSYNNDNNDDNNLANPTINAIGGGDINLTYINNDNTTTFTSIGNDYDLTQSLNDFNSVSQQHWTDLYSGLHNLNDENELQINSSVDNNCNDYPPLPPLGSGTITNVITTLPNFPETGKLPRQNTHQHFLSMVQPLSTKTLTVTSNLPKRLLPYNAFVADREVTTGDAIVFYLKTGRQLNVNDSNELDNAVKVLIGIKKEAKEMAYSHLTQDMLKCSKMIRMRNGEAIPNRRIEDICDIWAKNGDLAEQIWNLLIKRYQDMGEWEVKVEKEVMQLLNVEYLEEDAMNGTLTATKKDSLGNIVQVTHRRRTNVRGNKGCIAKMITLVKRDIVKMFNRAASNTHGIQITSVNPTVVALNPEGKKIYKKKNIKSSEFAHGVHLKNNMVCLRLLLLTFETVAQTN